MSWKIAIDGPAGAGKSTIAKILANVLKGEYLDTGAMYRAIALKSVRVGVNFEQLDSITDNDFLFANDTDVLFKDGMIYLDGEDVSELIRTPDMSSKASFVSKFGVVRTRLVALQQAMAEKINVIMDGRDIGTVVLPNANLKIFLVASSEIRALRRQKQLLEKSGEAPDLETLIKDINARDLQDSTRAISPLKKADDAIEIDSSNLTIDEVVQKIICLVKERGLIMEDVKTLNEETKEVVEEESTASVEESAAEETAQAEEATQVKELQLVEGTVVEVQDAEPEKTNRNGEVVRKAREARVLVELDNGQEGYLYAKEISDCNTADDLFYNYVEGDRVKLVVKKVYPDGGKVLLSQILVEKKESLKQFEEVIKNHGTFTAKVIKSIQVGLILEYNGYSCLLPTTQIANAEEAEKLIGTEIEVAPIRVDYNRIRLIVSQNVANAIKSRAEKSDFVASIKVGDVLEGTVKNIESYGAFIELGHGVEGLLHISEVEHNRIVKIEKVLNVGDAVKVQVIKLEEGHIGLSRKALLPNYWKNFLDTVEVGSVVNAKATEINKAGVVVELAEQVQGFLPKSEYSYNDCVLEDCVKAGDELQAKIIELDSNKKRIIISKKQLDGNPWETIQLENGQAVHCVAVKQEENGLKFNAEGLSGFLPKVNFPVDKAEFAVGEEFDAKVRIFDPSKKKLLVTMREPRPKEERIKRSFGENAELNNALKHQEKMTGTFGDFFKKEDFE